MKKNIFITDSSHLSFAAFSDTHIGAKYQFPQYRIADFLDRLGNDLINRTNKLDFAVHLGDIVNRNTAQVNGIGLPRIVNQYKNNLKDFLISHINLPFHCVIGNHDVNDYQKNKDNPHNLTMSIIDELSMNSPVYAMMRDGILFLVVPELGYITWTHPVIYQWIEFMTNCYQNKTIIILSHQAIEDTTEEKKKIPYRGKQDIDWWAELFQNNSQIKMWINGHNHFLDWYVDNKSSGITNPVVQFGHEMAFSAPYSQLDLGNYHEEDRIVIYNISSTKITTATWENNGFGGHWVSEYQNIWNIETTYDPDEKDWYSFPIFLQDNETQFTDMKLLSPNITLQLIGSKPMELFYDPEMQAPSGWANEVILGFDDDTYGNVEWLEPGMKVHGPTKISFPSKHLHNKILYNSFLTPIFNLYPNAFQILRYLIQIKYNVYQEDGRSGQPYQSFPMGTISAAIPNQTYNFSITARSNSGSGHLNLNVSCSDWGTQSQYSDLLNSEKPVISHSFGIDFETIYGSYTVPDDDNAWFLQGNLEFLDSTDYEVSLFSVKREGSSETSDDFHLYLSGNWYNNSGSLAEFEIKNFSVDPADLSNNDSVIHFKGCIGGNRFGIVNLIFNEPLLLCRNARFRVNDFSDGVFHLSLTKTVSRSLNVFKLFPFSTDSMYDLVDVIADDGSEIKHTGCNGNLWFSCNCPHENTVQVDVILNS